jgi:tetratricopeptide (TPR) repeat protein
MLALRRMLTRSLRRAVTRTTRRRESVATLAVYRGDQFVRHIELGEAPTRIGRGPENDVVLEDREKRVSRLHAEIRFERGQYIIADLNSQNGVWLGGHRIRQDPLPADVPITIGPYRLVLAGDAPRPSAVASPERTGTAQLKALEPTERDHPAVLVAPAHGDSSSQPLPPTQISTRGTQTETRVVAVSALGKRKRLLTAALAILAVAVTGLVVAALVGMDDPSPSPGTKTVVAPPASPPEPSLEDRFQEHYRVAQDHIAKGEKASALAANQEALKLRPGDPRGLEQQNVIMAMSDAPAGGAPASTDPGVLPTPEVKPASEKPAAAVTSTLTVAPRKGETASQRQNREKFARTHLEDGRKLLEEQQYERAISLFEAAIENSGRKDYGVTPNEASELLEKARGAKARQELEQRRAAAQKLLAEAKAAAASNIPEAVQKLVEAQKLDPQIAGVTDLLSGLREQARAQGEKALTSAKNYENGRRLVQAIAEYERAVQHLELVTGGHKDLGFARQRLAELRTPR